MQKAHTISDTAVNLTGSKRVAKCVSQGTSKVFASGIVQNKKISISFLEKVNKKISFMCKNNFICR